jgi:small conductance mechanosensitive channel
MLHPDYDALLRTYGAQMLALALNLAAAAAILIIGLWVAAWAGSAVRRASARHPRIDATIAAFLAWFVKYGLTAIVIIAVLRRFGFETTSVVALFGAAALAIGLALQGTLSNVAAGVMLILFRPYRLNDFVELNGRAGVVHDVNLFVTELIAPDQQKIVLPNGQCWGAPIVNYTAFALRRLDIDFVVPLSIHAERALAIAEAALAAEARLEKEPAPKALVKSIEFDRTTYTAQGWCPAQQQIPIRAAIVRDLRKRLDDELDRMREEALKQEEARALRDS